jgi:hypothetical protein
VRPVVSQAAEELFATLGPWRDADGEATGWVLLKMCEAIASPLQSIFDNARDQADGTPGWARVMSADTAPVDWLPWLGQFVGVKVDPYMSDALQRQQVKGEQGWQRGTVAYFRQQVQKWLQLTQRVDIVERDTSPYHFQVTVYRGELAGLHYDTLDAMYSSYTALDGAYATYNDMTSTSEQNLLDAAAAAKPAGLVMNLTVQPGLPA